MRRLAYGSKSIHPEIGDSYNNIANIYETKRDYDKALSLYNKYLTIT